MLLVGLHSLINIVRLMHSSEFLKLLMNEGDVLLFGTYKLVSWFITNNCLTFLFSK